MTEAGDVVVAHKLIRQLGHRIDRDLYLRLGMSAIVVPTALAGFISSWALLGAGLRAMALRHPGASHSPIRFSWP